MNLPTIFGNIFPSINVPDEDEDQTYRYTYQDAETIIAESITLSGNINGLSSVRIDGTLNGNISVSHYVVVGATGVVNGDISASGVLISGRVQGDIISNGTVTLTTLAQVVANIQAPSLIAEEGSKFRGNYNIGKFEEEENVATNS